MNYKHPAHAFTDSESDFESSGVDDYADMDLNFWSSDFSDEEEQKRVIQDFGEDGNVTRDYNWNIENYSEAKTWEEFIAGIPYWKLQAVRNFGDYFDWAERGTIPIETDAFLHCRKNNQG
jgi:hypothetical protein